MKMSFGRFTALCAAMIMILAWLSAPTPAPAALIPISNIGNLFNTGVDATHAPLPDDALDPHYSYTQFAGGPPPLSAAPTVATSTTGFPVAPAGPWLGDNAVSAWVTPAPDTTGN